MCVGGGGGGGGGRKGKEVGRQPVVAAKIVYSVAQTRFVCRVGAHFDECLVTSHGCS